MAAIRWLAASLIIYFYMYSHSAYGEDESGSIAIISWLLLDIYFNMYSNESGSIAVISSLLFDILLSQYVMLLSRCMGRMRVAALLS